MSWDDRLCIGKAGRCAGYRGAPCDCFGPWTAVEIADAMALLADERAFFDALPGHQDGPA